MLPSAPSRQALQTGSGLLFTGGWCHGEMAPLTAFLAPGWASDALLNVSCYPASPLFIERVDVAQLADKAGGGEPIC